MLAFNDYCMVNSMSVGFITVVIFLSILAVVAGCVWFLKLKNNVEYRPTVERLDVFFGMCLMLGSMLAITFLGILIGLDEMYAWRTHDFHASALFNLECSLFMAFVAYATSKSESDNGFSLMAIFMAGVCFLVSMWAVIRTLLF